MSAVVSNYDKNHDPENGEFSYGDGGTDPKKGPSSGKSDESSSGSSGPSGLTGKQAEQALNIAYRNKAAKMGGAKINALDDYVISTYRMNAELRTGEQLGEGSSIELKHLDGAIDANKTPTDLIVYRGGSEKDTFLGHGTAYGDPAPKVGSVFTDKGFVSTSTSKAVASHFAARDTVYEIHVPKGTGAAWMPTLTSSMAERELLLGRNHKFKITGYKQGNLHVGRSVFNTVQLELVK